MLLFFYFVKSLFIIRFLKHRPFEEQVFNILPFQNVSSPLVQTLHLTSVFALKKGDYFHRPEQPL